MIFNVLKQSNLSTPPLKNLNILKQFIAYPHSTNIQSALVTWLWSSQIYAQNFLDYSAAESPQNLEFWIFLIQDLKMMT